MRGILKVVLTIVLVLTFAGCAGTPIAQDLTQNQANEIVALLTTQGISAVATRETGGRGLYTVTIRDDRYAEAISLLHEKGLPRERSPWVKEILTSQGIIPSSREVESLRLDYALAAQLEDLIQNHPGVAAVRSIVRLNSLREGEEAGVSLVVQVRPGLQITKEELIPTVTTAIPGLKPERVSIEIGQMAGDGGKKRITVGVTDEGSYVLQVPLVPFLYFWRVPQSEYSGIALCLLGVLFLVGVLGIGLGYWSGFYRQVQKPIESELPMVLSKSNKVERVAREFREI